jgi:hypothetical protein
MKYQYKSLLALVALALVASLALWQKNVGYAAQQQRNWSLGGEARLTTNTILPYRSAVQLTSRCPRPDGRIDINACLIEQRLTTSGIVFTPPPTPKLRFADLYELSTDFTPRTPEMFSDCGGGSPRFEIGLDLNGDTVPDGNLFIYLGPLLEFRLCNGAWQNSGNLIGARDRRFDLQQFGGPFYGTYGDTVALVGHGMICYILLVVDSGWFPRIANAGNQNIHANNVRVNEHWLLTNTALSLDNLSLEPVELVPFDGSLSDWQQAFALEDTGDGTPLRRIPLYRPDFKPAESEPEK